MTVKITLNNFFGVEKNVVELSSFMIFCGDNGSGKTHLVKILNSIDEFLRNPEHRKNISFREVLRLNPIPLEIDVEKIMNKEPLQFTIEETEDLYVYIEELMNTYLKSNKNNILEETFSNTENVLEDLSVELNHRPIMNFEVVPNSSLKVNGVFTSEEVQEDEEVDGFFELKLKFSAEISEFSNGLGFSNRFFDEAEGEDRASRIKSFEDILKQRIVIGLMRLLYKENLNIPFSKSLYFPASREAYMRDFSFFFNRSNQENDSLLVKEYDLITNDEEIINSHSNDPYIENYVNQMITIMGAPDRYNEELNDFMEKEFLKAKIKSSKSDHSYILENEKLITTDLGSSLQNEYSFLRILIGRRKFFNIVVEEPEAHLSIKNAVLLAYIFISLHQKINGKVWITTHSNFVVDAINNIIMLSKLSNENQKGYLHKLGIEKILPFVDKSKTDEIVAYSLDESRAERLERNEFGIMYDSFLKQINGFVDVTTDLQWEVESLEETGEKEL